MDRLENLDQGLMKRAQTAIIGGGYAGLAAAVQLTAAGHPVAVFEAARSLGGRARGIEHRDLMLDNGQHILLGAYHETQRLIRLVQGLGAQAAVPGLLRKRLALAILPDFALTATAGPAPLHLLFGLLRAKGLSALERWQALRLMAAMRSELCQCRLADCSVKALLERAGQSPRLIARLWEPLCLAALNTPIEMASAQVFLQVLVDSFSHHARDADLLLPTHDLTRLFPAPAQSYIEANGGQVALLSPVVRIDAVTDGWQVTTRHGSEQFTQVILAVGPHQLSHLLKDSPDLAGLQELAAHFDYQPIHTVYLQYPPDVRLPVSMLGLSGPLGQWVFDRGQLSGIPGLLAVVISAAGPHESLTNEALAEAVHAELADCLQLPAYTWSRVINEKRATFACRVNLTRPAQQTAYPGIYLAGDYTAGAYPATLEGAVQSGVKCANLILQSPAPRGLST